jgi:hypothetical protein
VSSHAITAICLLAASIFYALGFVEGANGLVAIGMCFEGVFWMRVFRKNKIARTANDSIK